MMRKIVAALLIAMPTMAFAQVTIPSEYDKSIQQRSQIGSLSGDSFGDKVDLSTGNLEIIQTDIDLPGNNALPVRIGRRFLSAQGTSKRGLFGVWELDIPYLHTEEPSLGTNIGWVVEGANPTARCSNFALPPPGEFQGGEWDPSEFWHGYSFYLPGSGDQELLQTSGSVHAPNDGNTYAPIMTKQGAVVRCLSSLDATSMSGSSGEGFEIITPDGVVYTMNHMVMHNIEVLTKSSLAPLMASASLNTTQNTTQSIGIQPLAATCCVLAREEVRIYPTKVTDRFGNSVTYTWDTAYPWRLTRIAASDGRQLTLTYPAGTFAVDEAAGFQVSTITDGVHMWTYSGSGVTLPDGSAWSWSLGTLHDLRPTPTGVSCDMVSTSNLMSVGTGTLTSPSGATATYSMKVGVFGRSWVLRSCVQESSSEHAVDPYLFENLAVTGKTLTGPGLPAAGLSWTYVYGAANNCWDPSSVGSSNAPGLVACTSSSPTTRQTLVTDPDGNVTRYTFGNRWNVDEGLLEKEESGWTGSTALRTVQYVYADPAAPYAAYMGGSLRYTGDALITGELHPQRQVTTTQQGMTFTWQVASDCSGVPYCFDSYARPTKVVKSSTAAP